MSILRSVGSLVGGEKILYKGAHGLEPAEVLKQGTENAQGYFILPVIAESGLREGQVIDLLFRGPKSRTTLNS